jgi:hypothetical protein
MYKIKSKKEWKLKEKSSTHISYQKINSNKAVEMKKLYPSGTWNIDAYDYKNNRIIFGDGLPQYELSEKEAKKKLKKYMEKN